MAPAIGWPMLLGAPPSELWLARNEFGRPPSGGLLAFAAGINPVGDTAMQTSKLATRQYGKLSIANYSQQRQTVAADSTFTPFTGICIETSIRPLAVGLATWE